MLTLFAVMFFHGLALLALSKPWFKEAVTETAPYRPEYRRPSFKHVHEKRGTL